MSRTGFRSSAILISILRIALISFLLLLLMVFFTILGGARSAAPSTGDPFFATVPFDRWVAAGDHAQIPWEVQVAPPVLGFGLQLFVNVRVTVKAKELARHPAQGELLMLTQFTDNQGIPIRVTRRST
jgi:hypothetical protein